MAHITLSIPDEFYAKMKQRPEIKWSEVARQAIIVKLLSSGGTMSGSEFIKLLSPETRESIKKEDPEKAKEYYRVLKEKEWKRAQYLTHP